MAPPIPAGLILLPLRMGDSEVSSNRPIKQADASARVDQRASGEPWQAQDLQFQRNNWEGRPLNDTYLNSYLFKGLEALRFA
jgi:hypothetical protein